LGGKEAQKWGKNDLLTLFSRNCGAKVVLFSKINNTFAEKFASYG
jgi:hypothetical protein